MRTNMDIIELAKMTEDLTKVVGGLLEAVKAQGEVTRCLSEAVDLVAQKGQELENRVDANMRRIDQAVGKVSHVKGEVASLTQVCRLATAEQEAQDEARRALDRRVGALAGRMDAAEAALNRPAMDRLEFIQRACLQAGHDLELALQQALAAKQDVSAPLVKRLAEIVYGLRDLGRNDRLVRRMAEASVKSGGSIIGSTWAKLGAEQTGVLGQILTHVAMGNPDAALALTTPVKMGEPVRAEYHEIKASDYGPDGFQVSGPTRDQIDEVVRRVEAGEGAACLGCPKPGSAEDRAVGGST